MDKGKAEIIKKGDKDIITTIGNFVRPVIIRLLDYIRYRPKNIKVNRERKNTCITYKSNILKSNISVRKFW